MVLVKFSSVLMLCMATNYTSCTVCQTQLSKDSFRCCFYDSPNLTSKSNCTYNEGECSAGENWGTDEDFCDKFNWSTKSETHERIVCKGQKEPTDNKTLFQWECSNPPPDAKQADVILSPATRKLEIKSRSLFLQVTLENAYPEARSELQFEDKATQSECKSKSTKTEMNGLITWIPWIPLKIIGI